MRTGGSFCVEVTVPIHCGDERRVGKLIRHWWTHVWVPDQGTWKRVFHWRDQQIERVEMHYYFDEFSGPPEIISCKDSKLRFQLKEEPHKKLERLTSYANCRQQFPEVCDQPISIQNCEQFEHSMSCN